MTVADGLEHQQAAAPRGVRAGATSRLPVSAVALSAAAGVLLVAAADTAGRLGHASAGWADWGYWAGQALILLPVAVRLLGRRALTSGEALALVLTLTVAEYLVKVCYSPVGFTYPDELEHWRSALDVLQTGKLFGVNNLLPISPHYPGLEEVTSALVSVTGLPLFVSGLIIVGAAHLAFVCLLYTIAGHVSRSHRIAGITVIFYSSNWDFAAFDSMFVYQALALVFLALALLATWRLAAAETGPDRAGWLVLAVLAIMATVVTHHVTSYVLAAALALIALASLAAGGGRSWRWPAALSVMSVAAIACWVALAAPETVGYLQPTADGVVQGLRAIGGGHTGSTPVPSAEPLGNRALEAAAVLVLSALLPVGWWEAWRRHRGQAWVAAMTIGSVSWYVIIGVRFLVADGSELAGRASTFVFVPAAFVAALAVVRLVGAAIRWQARAVASVVLAGALILLFDGLANGWPPYWERLPGPHQVAGAERSVGPEELDSATWALTALGPGNRFATDIGSYPVLGSYGDQNPIRDVAYLYTTSRFTRSDALRASAQSIRYVLVDRRLSEFLPASGQYFSVDPDAGRYTRPLPLDDLTKFNNALGVERIYDSGNIVIYELPGSAG